jgi:hypothetical protein
VPGMGAISAAGTNLNCGPGLLNDMFSNIKTTDCQSNRKMLRTAALATLCASAAAFSSPAVFSNTAAKVRFVYCAVFRFS